MKNVKNYLLTAAIFIVTASTSVNAQQVIATSGGEFQNQQYSLSFTVGEPVIETFLNNNISITQGFEQPYSFYLQQILNIPAGWSGVSTYLDPLNKNMD